MKLDGRLKHTMSDPKTHTHQPERKYSIDKPDRPEEVFHTSLPAKESIYTHSNKSWLPLIYQRYKYEIALDKGWHTVHGHERKYCEEAFYPYPYFATSKRWVRRTICRNNQTYNYERKFSEQRLCVKSGTRTHQNTRRICKAESIWMITSEYLELKVLIEVHLP